MRSNLLRGLICLCVPLLILAIPVPTGLSVLAWQLLAVYIGAILGLMLKPVPEAVVLLTAIAVVGIVYKNIGMALSGYADPTAWLIFAAFMISICFIETGLGRRIAYLLIRYIGKSSLGLGYVAAFADLFFAPAIPSNTARTGGLVFPIFQSLVLTLDSKPGPTARRIGSYQMLVMYNISLVTAAMFITAGVIHPLNLTFAKNILHVEISWIEWAVGMFVPGILTLLAVPYLIYKIYPPEIKSINNREIANKGLQELGPITSQEKRLLILFVIALLGWSTSIITKINATAIAIGIVAASVWLGIVKWKSLLACEQAFNTFLWFAGIVSLANGMGKEKLFSWLGQVIANNFNIAGLNQYLVLFGILFISIIVRYLFASTAAYVATLIPVFYTLGALAHLPAKPLVLIMAASSMLGSVMTHYGNALGPILFGTGYVEQSAWWKIGHIVTIVGMVIWLIAGAAWWKILGMW
ncbi:anion transporter [Thermosinus carboxydivorans Nor1]|uniref:Anion transporter n=1 Tax=Thermosinus carboxydivorans Nor1 TaxID=401526 RepID=A1HNF7_9FIRM|nr:DASS family sodium-coupled anion symporter [Thermosinus carboxydivorans]EAX48316.1 anion transporter [Thermosinus carboxydivorans Nor1]